MLQPDRLKLASREASPTLMGAGMAKINVAAQVPKDLPQPQVWAALGLVNWKPPPIKASL